MSEAAVFFPQSYIFSLKYRWSGFSAYIYWMSSWLVMPRDNTVSGQPYPEHLSLINYYSSYHSSALRTRLGTSTTSTSDIFAHQMVCANTMIRISLLIGHLLFLPGKNQPLLLHSLNTSGLRRALSFFLYLASNASFCFLLRCTFIMFLVFIYKW